MFGTVLSLCSDSEILQSFVVMNMVLGTDTVKLVDCGSCFFLVNNGRLNS